MSSNEDIRGVAQAYKSLMSRALGLGIELAP